MPLPIENIPKDSSPEQVQEAISASISQCVNESDRGQDQCVAIAHDIARRRGLKGAK